MTMRYRAYQLTIDSELPLPELVPPHGAPAIAGAAAAPSDVTIRLGALGPLQIPAGRDHEQFRWQDENNLLMRVPGVCRIMVSNGRDVLVEPAPGIDPDSLRDVVLSDALVGILFQRGYLVLHGNAVRVGDNCLVCLGDSGAGKSTLAAGFWQRGFQVLAEDTVVIDEHGRALPSIPRIKLWQQVTDRLGIDTGRLSRIAPGIAKFSVPIDDQVADRPLPVRWIYLLEPDDSDAIALNPVRGMDRLPPLRHHTHMSWLARKRTLEAGLLRRGAQLASRVRMARLNRPRHRFELDKLIDRLLADTTEPT